MEVTKQTKLIFHGVDIININFSAIAPIQEELKIDIKFDPKVFYPDENINVFKIVMDIELKDERFFELTLKAIGNF